MVKRSNIEEILDVLVYLSPKCHDGRLNTFLPFSVRASANDQAAASAPQPAEVKDKEGVESEKPNDQKPVTKIQSSAAEDHSLKTIAKQKVNQDYICFEWLQDMGSPVCKKSVEELINELGASICNKLIVSK